MSFEQGASLDDGRYELRRRIGSGGMASVWLAQDTRLERPVAIKIPTEGLAIDPVFARRFEREALLAASLSHPHLVPVYDYGREGERSYLVMEYVDGQSLSELAERDRHVDAAALARALLGALAHIHAAGIVHRDVKPGNVLVERSGRILLTDFGIAQADEATQLTGTGQVIGTLRYIAPEVMNGERASARSDLYACGVLLGEFVSDDDPPALHRLVAELSADDPTERPGSARSALALAPPAAGSPDAVERPTAPLAQDEPSSAEPAQGPAGSGHPAAGEEGIGGEIRPRFPSHPAQAPGGAPRAPASAPSPPAGSRSPQGPGWMPRIVLGFAVLAAIAAVVVAIAASGGDDEPSNGASKAEQSKPEDKGSGGSGGASEEPATEPEAAATGLPEPAATPNTAEAASLNAQGKELIDAGDPAGAVPILEEAVSLYPSDSSEVEFGYALFNYAQALRLSGQPEAAIPVLERRMQIDDQLDIVQAELDLAREEAGQG